MARLRACLLSATALGCVGAFPLSTLADEVAPVGLEGGNLADWTTHGEATAVASDQLSLGGTQFELRAKADFMAKSRPAGRNFKAPKPRSP